MPALSVGSGMGRGTHFAADRAPAERVGSGSFAAGSPFSRIGSCEPDTDRPRSGDVRSGAPDPSPLAGGSPMTPERFAPLTALAAFSILLAASPSLAADDGDPDPSYGSSGVARIDLAGGDFKPVRSVACGA